MMIFPSGVAGVRPAVPVQVRPHPQVNSQKVDALDTNPKPESPTGVTDEIIRGEVQAHWTARLMRPMRRLYEWVLHWAETRYAGTALAAVAFSEAVWFPIPADPLLVALCLGKPKRSFWYALNCTFWSTFGAMLAMLTGTLIGEERVLGGMAWIDQHLTWLPAWLHLDLERYARMALDLFRHWGFWAVAVAALSPIPYKVFAWIAGFAGVHWLTFLAATVIFRKFRYFVIGGLIYKYGERARRFIDKYFSLTCAAIMAVLVLVLVAVRYKAPLWETLSKLFGG
jgi:membrane protein YqaA with SNARE-associated domain